MDVALAGRESNFNASDDNSCDADSDDKILTDVLQSLHLATVLPPTSHKVYIFQIGSLGFMVLVNCIGNNCIMKIAIHLISYWIQHSINH